jgi:predicted CopG family antitoxin
MPTQTAYFGEEVYQYILESKDEDQTTSARIAELVEKGKEVEQNE